MNKANNYTRDDLLRIAKGENIEPLKGIYVFSKNGLELYLPDYPYELITLEEPFAPPVQIPEHLPIIHGVYWLYGWDELKVYLAFLGVSSEELKKLNTEGGEDEQDG